MMLPNHEPDDGSPTFRDALVILCAILALLVLSCIGAAAVRAEIVRIWTTPENDATQGVIDQMGSAKQSIDLQMFSFTSQRIAKAAIDAHKRGVKVRILLDDGQANSKFSQAQACADAGISVRRDKHPGFAHNKTCIIDGVRSLFGSFNYSVAAQFDNAETMFLDTSKKIAQTLLLNFEKHWEHSKQVEPTKK